MDKDSLPYMSDGVGRKTTIVCISDTHTFHQEIANGYGLPYGDVLIHSGDATMNGSLKQMAIFISWMAAQPHKHKIFVPGNHDFCAQSDMSTIYGMCIEGRIQMLIDRGIEIGDNYFFGSPWVPNLSGWAFYATSAELERRFSAIPEQTNVLVTHGPPSGTLDVIPGARLLNHDPHGQPQDEWTDDKGLHVGSVAMLSRVVALPRLKLHVFGHIHESYGREGRSVNASVCDRDYKPVNKPIVAEI